MRSFAPPSTARTFLMLQGHPSPFWRELGAALTAEGHRVIKVNFAPSDALFWRGPAHVFRGRFGEWRRYVARLAATEGVTDILYYADQLPYHREARDVARILGLRAWAFEFGYLRPDWLTMERDGMGALSHFPKDRRRLGALAIKTPEPDMVPRYLHGFGDEAKGEVLHNLANVFARWAYPFYHSDRPHWPPLEYLSWLPLLLTEKRDDRRARQTWERLTCNRTPYNLIAMQMRDDYQIRASSPYSGLQDFLEEVFDSFRHAAPRDRQLLIKLHPLESGLPRWQSRIPKLARHFGIEDRVHVVRGGDLGGMIGASEGVVMVNSTVGLHALAAGRPVAALGAAVYDMPGLTHQRGLDRFWTDPDEVDPVLFRTFRRALASIQVKGSFFHPEGRQVAIAEICRRFAIDTTVETAVDLRVPA